MNLEESLRALAADEAATRVPPRVDASVMAAWDAHSGAGAERAHTAQHGPAWLWWAGIVAAGLAALAVAAGWPAAHEPKEAVRGSAPVNPVAPGPAQPEARSALTGSVARPAPGQRARLSSAPRREAEAEAAYVLVPDAETSAPPLTLMRVRMPRSTFSRLGVPISNPDGDGMVDVDVLVGEDGVARSIRRAVAVGWADPNP